MDQTARDKIFEVIYKGCCKLTSCSTVHNNLRYN